MHACNTKVDVPLVIAIHISSCSAMHRAIFHSKLVMYQFISLYAYVLVNRSTWFHLALISPSESTSLHHTSLVPWTLDWSHYFLHWYLTLYIPSNTLCTRVFWLEHLHCRVSQKISSKWTKQDTCTIWNRRFTNTVTAQQRTLSARFSNQKKSLVCKGMFSRNKLLT